MQNKQIKHSYGGMNQDITKSQFPNNYYFQGNNIRINATTDQGTSSVMNEKGNSLIITIPIPVINKSNPSSKKIIYNDKELIYKTTEIDTLLASGEQIIIGHSNSRNYLILFTTDNAGFDCIWKVDYETYDITLLYLRNLNFSINNPIQIINNFENEKSDKIYWVNGINQMGFLNIKHSIENDDAEELIDVSKNIIFMSGRYELSEPLITNIISGGNHTSGRIQYAYNLYKIGGVQTKLSSISKLISLGKDSGGGDINEIVGSTPIVEINNIDDNYDSIRVYAIKYTSLNQIPSISLINDSTIPNSGKLQIFDDGSIIQSVSIEEFIFLGSDIIIPKHINTKFNRLFFANYKEINFKVNVDTRAYSYNSSKIATVYKDLRLINNIPSGDSFTIYDDLDYDDVKLIKHDSVNLKYDVFKYQKNGITKGGEGKYLKYELTQSLTKNDDNRYFKDDEIYRIGIQFYNSYGQVSNPNWIADFKALNENLLGKYNTLKVTLKPEFFIWLNNTIFENDYDKPIGYKILVAERTDNDKTIIASGLLSTMMINDKSTFDMPINYMINNPEHIPYIKTKGKTLTKLPNILIRNCNADTVFGNTRPLVKAIHMKDMSVSRRYDTEIQRAESGNDDTAGRFYQFNAMLQLYSPEILFNKLINFSEGLNFKVKGSLKNHINNSWAKTYEASTDSVFYEAKTSNGLSSYFAGSTESIIGNPAVNYEKGLIGQMRGSSSDRVTHSMFYRNYGVPYNNKISNSNTVTISNDLTLISGIDGNPAIDDDELISLDVGRKKIIITLNDTHQEGYINYDITPDIINMSTLYNIKITTDNQGNNILESLNNIIGNQSISHSLLLDYPTELTSVNNFYLVIESLDNFECNVDISVSNGVSSTPEYILYETLNNNVIFTPISTDSLFKSSTIDNMIPIYGKPEITELGQSGTDYNQDSNYRYYNGLEGVLTDGDSSYNNDGLYNRKIVTISSQNNKCVTFVPGANTSLEEHWNRPLIEDMFSNAGLNGDNNGLIGEIIKSDNDIYLGGIYGGNSYEDKLRTNYIEIGNYNKLNILNPSVNINSPGDTFVNSFKFLRIVRKDNFNIEEGVFVLEELVEYLCETTIDLKNRNDTSNTAWDDKFLPLNVDYHKYNNVYSQQSNLIQRRNLDYNIKLINNFETNVLATKLKSPGELIDSWTDLLINDVITLDGKYGSINSLTNFNDELYTIQDSALARLSISPRVQIQGNDGLSVQLGTGSVLDKYNYISTKSGTINKWSVVPTSIGIYYYDLLNKSFALFNGGVNSVSDIKMMHSYFTSNTELDGLKTDNPLIKQGISSGYDQINNDIFMTFHRTGNKPSFTISYNEARNQFISFYDYLPSMYISKGQYFITTHPNLKSIYRQYAGDYNNFYGQNYPSYIILNVNPEANLDTVFDNIMYKSEVYLNDIDQPDKTLTGIRLYNEYQDSNSPTTVTPLILGRNSNLRRKFRDWNAILPRNQGSRERIRNPWVKLVLQFDNTSNYKLILHDISISYSI